MTTTLAVFNFSGVQDGDLSCCLCQTDVSDKPNEIVLCDNCGLGMLCDIFNMLIN